jgi:hypothetical protein
MRHETMKCTGCGIVEDERLIDGAPESVRDHDFNALLCIRCYGEGKPHDSGDGTGVELVTWAPAGDVRSPSAISRAPALAPFYAAFEARA